MHSTSEDRGRVKGVALTAWKTAKDRQNVDTQVLLNWWTRGGFHGVMDIKQLKGKGLRSK